MDDIKRFLQVGEPVVGVSTGFGTETGDGCGMGGNPGCGDYIGFGDGVIRFVSAGYIMGPDDGYDNGYGDISRFCGQPVFMVDDVPTLIYRARGNIAKGAILQADLTLRPCYIVKQDGVFAHGTTLREAMDALREKVFDDADEYTALADAFIDEHPDPRRKYPCKDLSDWHSRLTGSCDIGRKVFASNHGINIERDSLTVRQFIELTRNAYGGEVIRLLEARLAERSQNRPAR